VLRDGDREFNRKFDSRVMLLNAAITFANARDWLQCRLSLAALGFTEAQTGALAALKVDEQRGRWHGPQDVAK
jgi:hypothetical protein